MFNESDYERAAALELAEREDAIRAAVAAPAEEPLEVGGVRYCLDCEKPIDRRRIRALPTAVRCVECQEEQALRERRHGRRA